MIAIPLPDLLAPDLHLVVCGTAAGEASARRAAYYAGPGNKFWKTLHWTGLTSRLLTPAEYPELLHFGIGLTDIVKGQSGADAAIDFKRADRGSLRAKILAHRPRILCFNGKRAAQEFFQKRKVTYGLQPESLGMTALFVAPSTSGAANGTWDQKVWAALARRLGT